MLYSLLNLSVIAVRVASTQQSPGLLQGLLNGFTSSSHSAAHTETLNTSLQSIHNRLAHTLTQQPLTHPNTHACPIRWHKTEQWHQWEPSVRRAKAGADTFSWLSLKKVCMWPPRNHTAKAHLCFWDKQSRQTHQPSEVTPSANKIKRAGLCLRCQHTGDVPERSINYTRYAPEALLLFFLVSSLKNSHPGCRAGSCPSAFL